MWWPMNRLRIPFEARIYSMHLWNVSERFFSSIDVVDNRNIHSSRQYSNVTKDIPRVSLPGFECWICRFSHGTLKSHWMSLGLVSARIKKESHKISEMKSSGIGNTIRTVLAKHLVIVLSMHLYLHLYLMRWGWLGKETVLEEI